MADRSEIVRQEIVDTRAAMAEKIESVEHQVRDNVISAAQKLSAAADLVADSVHSAQSAVDQTIQSVKATCDVRGHVQKRPWTMLIGAAALGYVGTKLAQNHANGEHRVESGRRGSVVTYHDSDREEVRATESRELDAPSARSSRISKFAETLDPELSMIKGLVIGVAAGILRDMVVQSVPDHVGGSLVSIFDSVTQKLGGQPVAGRVRADRSLE